MIVSRSILSPVLPLSILRDRAAHARRRRPDGAPMRGYAWLARDGAVWLVPDGLPPAHQARSATAEALFTWQGPADETALYWLAHAARQDLWRALSRVPGPGPMVGVAPVQDAVRITAGLLGLPGRPPPPGTPAAIARVLGAPAMRRHVTWARRRGS